MFVEEIYLGQTSAIPRLARDSITVPEVIQAQDAFIVTKMLVSIRYSIKPKCGALSFDITTCVVQTLLIGYLFASH